MIESKIKAGSLFSGVGGIELGLERAGGFETVWFVENEPYARAVLKKRFPEAALYGDITTINFKDLQRVDVLTGGFPCQDISNAGKRAGITGSRSSLWKHYARAISELRPRIALIENVAALTRRGLDTVLCDLAALGYDAEWHCFPAKAVGAPHQRDRIIIITYTNKGYGRKPQSVYNERNKQKSEQVMDGQAEKYSDERGESSQLNTRQSSKDVADTDKKGLQREYEEEYRSWQSKVSLGRCGWWAVEPDVGRVAHGVSHRVDRIKCLGNAVVPAWAEAIGKTIKKVMFDGFRT